MQVGVFFRLGYLARVNASTCLVTLRNSLLYREGNIDDYRVIVSASIPVIGVLWLNVALLIPTPLNLHILQGRRAPYDVITE